MTTIDQHALCKILAKWAGVAIKWHVEPNREGWVYLKQTTPYEHWDYWDPLSDANQLELVKAGLREAGYGYEITWAQGGKRHRAEVFRPRVPIDLPLAFCGYHESESLALALAIHTMEENNVG